MTQAQKLKDRVKMKNDKDVSLDMKRSRSGGNEKYRAEIESTVKNSVKLRCTNKEEEIRR